MLCYGYHLGMEILGRTLSTEYEAFRASVESELNVDITYEAMGAEEASQIRFGRTRVNLGSSTSHIWMNLALPDDAFSSTAAHELAHVLQVILGHYKPMVRWEEPVGSFLSIVSERLDGATECIACDQLTAPYGLDASYSVAARYKVLLEELRTAQRSSPLFGSLEFASAALRYIRARFEQPVERLEKLKRGFEAKLPGVVVTADVLRQRVLACGLTTVDQRRDSMLILRDGLRLQGKVEILPPDRGRVSTDPWALDDSSGHVSWQMAISRIPPRPKRKTSPLHEGQGSPSSSKLLGLTSR